MAAGSQLNIATRPGYATETQCVILVTSLSNASTTLTCNNTDYAVSWNAVGEDRGSGPTNAGYVDHITVTGLTAFTQYTYTVTQGSDTATGSFYTLPSDTDDFCFWFVNCDNNVAGLVDYDTGKTGMYDQIKEYNQSVTALPCVGMLHVDDLHGYPALHECNDTATGHSTTGQAQVTALEYDYAISYQAAYGLLGDDENAINWGWDTDRVWCMQNMNLWPQWGDWEFQDDLGWDVDNTTPTSTYTAGKAVWDDFMLPMQPPTAQDADTTSNHWAFALGGIKIVAPDGITNGDAGVAPNKVIYGNNQIDDIKTVLSTDEPFKILTLEHGIRYLDSTQHEFKSGTQHPIYDGALAEYQRLFTNTTNGLMQNNKTNGLFGTMITLHGDYHRGLVLKNEKAAYASNDAEWFYSIHNGTVNGSINFDVDGNAGESTIKEGLTFDGSTVEYLQDSGTFTYAGTSHKFHATRIEYYGSKFPKEMHVVMIDRNGTEVFKKKFVHQRGSNDAFDVNDDISAKGASIGSYE